VTTARASYVRSGDAWIAYRVIGDGPFDLVYQPGFMSHVELIGELPTNQGHILRRLASFARVIVFDQRGVGMSDRVSGVPTLEARMDDLRAVLDAAASPRAAILSVGNGVPMSLLFAASHPDRVSAIVLARGFARELWAPDYPWGWSLERQRAVVDGYKLLFLGSLDEAAEALAGIGSAFGKAELEYFRRAAGTPGTVETMAAMNREIDVRHVLPAVRVPTLLLHATEEQTFPAGGVRYIAEHVPGAKLVELAAKSLLAPPGIDRMLDESERFLADVWQSGAWAEPESDRVLATVLFTDIVESSQRAVELGDRAWRELLAKHHELVRRQLVRFRGREVDNAGDGFLASFDGPARAIRCAQAIVDGVGALGLEVRAGLHTGECELLDGKVAGVAVHTGARVASHAAPREVLVSSTVKDLVAGSGLAFQDRGAHELKGLGEWRLYAVQP
jgi:class 3 adenylate cyclase/pimeloyl-ACP methyl ester carboxylesterase